MAFISFLTSMPKVLIDCPNISVPIELPGGKLKWFFSSSEGLGRQKHQMLEISISTLNNHHFTLPFKQFVW